MTLENLKLFVISISDITGLPMAIVDSQNNICMSTFTIDQENLPNMRYAVDPVLNQSKAAAYPQIFLGRFGHVHGAIPYPEQGPAQYYIYISVVCFRKIKSEILMKIIKKLDLSKEVQVKLLQVNDEIKVYAYPEYLRLMKMIYYMIYNKMLDESRLIYESEKYRMEQASLLIDGESLYSDGAKQNAYDDIEEYLLDMIRNGNLNGLKMAFKENIWPVKGDCRISDIRSAKNFMIRSITLASRAAVEGGIGREIAFSLADMYLEQTENCKLLNELEILYLRVYFEYTRRVQSLVDVKVQTKKVSETCRYINEHINEFVTVQEIADSLSISPEHLSRQFHQETGITIISYIRKSKMKEATYLLKYSNYSIGEIAELLAYNNQSHFSRMFKKEKGMTPIQFRNM